MWKAPVEEIWPCSVCVLQVGVQGRKQGYW